MKAPADEIVRFIGDLLPSRFIRDTLLPDEPAAVRRLLKLIPPGRVSVALNKHRLVPIAIVIATPKAHDGEIGLLHTALVEALRRYPDLRISR